MSLLQDFADAYDSGSPWDAVLDGPFTVAYGLFWVAVPDEPDTEAAVPAGDQVAGSKDAVGVPTTQSDGRAAVALSYWEAEPTPGAGLLLGQADIQVLDREVVCVNATGREPGPVLLLPEGREHLRVRVWRRPMPDDTDCEQYDVRLWPSPTQ